MLREYFVGLRQDDWLRLGVGVVGIGIGLGGVLLGSGEVLGIEVWLVYLAVFLIGVLTALQPLYLASFRRVPKLPGRDN